jgi:hypothetical protein
MANKKAPSRNLTGSVPVKLSPAIETKLRAAMKETGLKKSDIIRMSVERGVDVLLAQLTSEPVKQTA